MATDARSGRSGARELDARGSKIAELKSRWTEYLRRNRLKTTGQREAIVDEFLRSHGHVSIDEMLSRVRRKNARVGHATVYRTLKLLTESELAEARQFEDGQTRYEVKDHGHHDHLICVKCGLILEFEDEQIEKLQDADDERLGGFKILRHKLELYGLCPRAQGIPNGNCPSGRG
jgi:Fur family ferric uptake transcriptional regulator